MFDPPTFIEAFRFFPERPFASEAIYRVIFILVATFLFILTQYVRIRGEYDKRLIERDSQDKLVRGLAVLPRVEFMFELSPETYDSIDDLLSEYTDRLNKKEYMNMDSGLVTTELAQVAKRLRAVLWSLASLAENYGSSGMATNRGIRYGASLMMYVEQKDFATVAEEYKSHVGGCAGGRLRFLEADFPIGHLRGLLVLSKDLLITDSDADDVNSPIASPAPYSALALPVRNISSEYQLAGSPRAIDAAKSHWVCDVREYVAKSSDQGPQVMQQLQEYFSDDGDGSTVRSLLSIPIGSTSDPMAIVSFDADVINLLGDRPDHYRVFTSLVRPALVLMRPAVKYYRALKLQAGKTPSAE